MDTHEVETPAETELAYVTLRWSPIAEPVLVVDVVFVGTHTPFPHFRELSHFKS